MHPLLLPATPPADAPLAPEGEAALAAARQLLDRTARVLLSDGRLVVGRFYCLDREGNVVLVDAFTQSPAKAPLAGAGMGEGAGAGKSSSAPTEEPWRSVGVVMVPGRHLVRIEVEAAAS